MLNLVSQKAVAGGFSNAWNRVAPPSIWIAGKWDLKSSSSNWSISSPYYNNFVAGGSPCGISTISTNGTVSHESPSVQKEKISSPWLMLPPVFEGGNLLYKFYSLAENKVLSFKNQNRELELSDEDTANLLFVGSSHGWLSLFNKRNCDFFLYNPISGRHINLPSYNTLPFSKDIFSKIRYVNQLIISCSPDEEDCRAMLSYSNLGTLAFCCPGHSLEWTPLLYSREPDSFVYSDEDFVKCYSDYTYESFVYANRQSLFFSVTMFHSFEAWDLRDSCPRLWKRNPTMADVWVDEGKHFLAGHEVTATEQHLAIAEHSGEVYFLRRFVMIKVDDDDKYAGDYETVGFDVHKYNPNPMDIVFKYMDPSCNSCLDDLAFFIGKNNGFALRANEYPELKPNSIYFTDTSKWYMPTTLYGYMPTTLYGGHDIGIYSYKDGTISSCYYPSDVRKITPSPIWFTPCSQ